MQVKGGCGHVRADVADHESGFVQCRHERKSGWQRVDAAPTHARADAADHRMQAREGEGWKRVWTWLVRAKQWICFSGFCSSALKPALGNGKGGEIKGEQKKIPLSRGDREGNRGDWRGRRRGGSVYLCCHCFCRLLAGDSVSSCACASGRSLALISDLGFVVLLLLAVKN
ncbi:hypothetical protein KFK09_015504 [Dendrobium nobile]|uniref:Uncharacterized protein n=1 Tax=Dendrobium nobile TaxID=94219 RepID=A0A8T3B675_DENNO|nr:hypothetical protein KFK09_015504 [Dendrobium nobile]